MQPSNFAPHFVFLISVSVFTLFSKNNFIFGSAVYFPLYCYMVLIITAFALSFSKKECFSGAFRTLSKSLYFFGILLASPLIAKIPFPAPHDFIQRKFEVLLGSAYSIFFIVYALITAQMLVKKNILESIKLKYAVIAAASLFFILYISLSFWMNRANAPTGDEPIYLLVAHSIVNDADLDLRNNYENKDYSRFFPGELKPQEIEHNGRLVSYHPVLISLIIAPFYGMMGRQGVSIIIAVICALIAAIIMLMADEIIKNRGKAFLVSVFSALSLPLIMFSNQICADTISALLITGAFYMIFREKGGGVLPAITTGLILWAHPRNIPVYGILIVMGILFNRKDIKKLSFFILINLTLAAALFWFNYIIYGSLIPRQTQDDIPVHQVFGFNMAGILGLLFDKEFGLFIYTPLFILLPSAYILLYKKDRKLALWSLAMLLPYYALISSWADWRGGGGSSPRFLLQVLPFIVLPLAVFTEAKSRIVKILFWGGIFVSAVLTCVPWFRWSKGLGENWILKFMSSVIKFDLNSLLPSFWVDDSYAYLKSAVFVGFIVWANIMVLKEKK